MKHIKYLTCLILAIMLYSCEPKEKIIEYDWKDISIESVGIDWRSIQMLDENMGFVGGIPLTKTKVIVNLNEPINKDTFMYNMDYTYENEQMQSCLYKTINGGDTWKAVSTPFRNGVKQVFFFDNQTGYISTFNEGVFKTTDGGLNWKRVLGHVYYGNGQFSDGAFYLNFSDIENGYCYYESFIPFTLKTTDGGTTWNKIENVNGKYIYKENQIGYSKTSNKLYKTSDNDGTWSLLNTNNYNIYDIYFYTSEHFLVSTDNKIIETKNSGETWTSYALPVKYGTQKITVFDNEVYILDLESIYHFSNIFQIESNIDKNVMERQKKDRIFDISFPNPNIGFAVGDNGMILRYKKQ